MNKGTLNGNCNRGVCDNYPANFFNTSTRSFYCKRCAFDINSFAKRCDGFYICFKVESNEEASKMEFGKEYNGKDALHSSVE